MSSITHVSIVLVHYNTPDLTLNCVKSLQELRKKNFNFDIVIVDNGSRDVFKLPQKYSKNVMIIRSDANLGFTGGNNLGITRAIEAFNSEYVLLLNTDTLVDSSAVAYLVETLEKNSKFGAVCPKIYFAKNSEFHINSYKKQDLGNVLWYAGGSIDWQHLAAFHRGVDEIDRGQFDLQKTSDFATGCAVLIRREVLEKIGGFDDRYFLYMEDVDLSLQIKNLGYQIGFDPKAKVWHINAGSSGGSGSSVHEFYQTRNRLLLAFSHGNWNIWLTALRIAIKDMRFGGEVKKKAVFSALTGRYGKQTVI